MIRCCTKCGATKAAEKFAKSRQRPSGYSSWCKACHCKQACEYQAKNKERLRINKERYKKTEKGGAAKARYYCSAARKAGKKRYNSGEYGKAASIRWYSNRRTRTKAVKNTLTKDEWAEILATQDNRCNHCRVRFDSSNILTRAERDHIIPATRGGALVKENVQGLCRSCNARKSAKLPEEWQRRHER